MRRMRGLAAAGAAAAALGLAACGGGGGGGAAVGADSAASIAPASATAFVAIDSDLGSDQWQKVDALLSRFPGRAKLVASLRRELREQFGVGFEQDLQAALGPEVDLVWLDFRAGGRHLVAVTRPDDPAKLDEVVRKGNADSTPGDRLRTERLEGGWVALGTDEPTLRRFRTASLAANAPRLADDATFRAALASVPGDALATAFLDGAAVTSSLRSGAGNRLSGARDRLIGGCGGISVKLDWLAGSVRADDDGASLEATVHAPAGPGQQGLADAFAAHAARLPAQVPAGALLYLSAANLKQAWIALARQCPLLRRQATAAGFDVDALAGLFAGESALYIREAAPLPEITLVTEVQDAAIALADADKAVRSILRRLGVPLVPTPATFGKVAGRRVDLGTVALVYAVVDGKLVVSDMPSGITAVADTSTTRLADEPAFRDALAAASMPDTTSAFLYVNVAAALPVIDNFAQVAGTPLPAEVRANLEPVRSAVLYATQDGDGVGRSKLFVRIGGA